MGANGQVDLDLEGNIAWLTLARPGKKNALTRAMWASIPTVLTRACHADVAVVALRGEGGTFGAGADLADVLSATRSREDALAYCSLVVRALLSVATCALPTLALIDGMAAGGAAELALAADCRIAERSARLSFPFARLGIVPDRFTLSRLVALVGPGAARDLTLTGRMLEAPEACTMGLVDEVAPPGSLATRARSWASAVANGSPRAIANMRRTLFDIEHPGLAGLDDLEGLIGPMVESFLSGDVRSAAEAFLGKPLDPKR